MPPDIDTFDSHFWFRYRGSKLMCNIFADCMSLIFERGKLFLMMRRLRLKEVWSAGLPQKVPFTNLWLIGKTRYFREGLQETGCRIRIGAWNNKQHPASYQTVLNALKQSLPRVWHFGDLHVRGRLFWLIQKWRCILIWEYKSSII